MHLIVRERHGIEETATAEDLDLSPADFLVLSFSDSDLMAVASAWRGLGNEKPTLRLAPLSRLRHPASVDLFLEKTAHHAKAIAVRLLGGLDYWRYGAEQLSMLARARGIRLAFIPGDGRPDFGLTALSTVDPAPLEALFNAGGPQNLRAALQLMMGGEASTPKPVPLCGVYRNTKGARKSLIVFYRSYWIAGDLAPVDALIEALAEEGVGAEALFVPSLKDPAAKAFLSTQIAAQKPDVIVNITAFSARDGACAILDEADCPVLQVALSLTSRGRWQEDSRGLSASCLAMNVVLPEVDGRIFAGAISFKEPALQDVELQFAAQGHAPDAEMILHTAKLAANSAHLRHIPEAKRKIGLVLSTYPGREDQIAHAVGLDGPESAARIAEALAQAGYNTGTMPHNGEILLADVARARILWSIEAYQAAFAKLDPAFQASVLNTWGEPKGPFALPIAAFGHLFIALQPDRGTLTDRKSGYHDPNLAPCHSYIAFYLYLRHELKLDALVHLGAHGTLEWLPGKAVALSNACAPRALIGALPVIYPFIVNDPGEAAQAKRRISAITLGHMTPKLTRSALADHLQQVERLVDEFASAEGLDPKRRKSLAPRIVEAALAAGIGAEIGVHKGMDAFDSIAKIDAFLCDLKEMSIRDGLHIYGQDAPGEMSALLHALDGRFIAPGPSGAPSRGRADVLPTGRNLFAIDPRAVPTRTAADNGQRAAEAILARYFDDHGEHPRALVMDLWGSASIRTGGEELAVALWLMGVRPQWDDASNRVSGVDILTLAELGRARVDVTLRISGLFRDLFPAQLDLFALAVAQVAARDDEAEENPLAASQGPHWRIFGAADGAYGAGVTDLIDSGNWKTRADLGHAWLNASHTAYQGADALGPEPVHLATRLREADALVHIHDHIEADLLSANDYAAHQGGMVAALEAVGAAQAVAYHTDTSDPTTPKARTLNEEAARIVLGRAIAPAYLQGQMRHGFAGAGQMAVTVDSAFAFAATSGVVTSAHFDRLYDAYLGDPAVASFLSNANQAAREAIRARFQEAVERGLWQPRRNSVFEELSQ